VDDYSVMRALVVDASTDRGDDCDDCSGSGSTPCRRASPTGGRKYDCARWHSFSLDTSATSGRFAVAVFLDCLRNMKQRKGRPARPCLGDRITEEMTVLPEAEVLQCSGSAQHACPRISRAGHVRSLHRVRLTLLRESEQPDGWTPAQRLHLPFKRYGSGDRYRDTVASGRIRPGRAIRGPKMLRHSASAPTTKRK
jgi:hypothetical protein